MNTHRSIDYKEAERRYVVEGQSVRSIARELGLKSWSSMNTIALREDWKGKRQAYLNAIARRSYEHVAEGVAHENSEITKEAVLAGRATIRLYLDKLSRKEIAVTAKDALLWAQFLLSEMNPSHVEESSEAPNVRNVTPPDAELLRRVVEAARERVAPAGSLGSTPLVQSKDTRAN